MQLQEPIQELGMSGTLVSRGGQKSGDRASGSLGSIYKSLIDVYSRKVQCQEASRRGKACREGRLWRPQGREELARNSSLKPGRSESQLQFTRKQLKSHKCQRVRRTAVGTLGDMGTIKEVVIQGEMKYNNNSKKKSKNKHPSKLHIQNI